MLVVFFFYYFPNKTLGALEIESIKTFNFLILPLQLQILVFQDFYIRNVEMGHALLSQSICIKCSLDIMKRQQCFSYFLKFIENKSTEKIIKLELLRFERFGLSKSKACSLCVHLFWHNNLAAM